MKVLIVGYSNLVRRKIIDSFTKLEQIESIEIASSKKISSNNIFSKSYPSYEDGIENSDASLVYISLPNSLHFKYALLALKNRKHVIVDKPAVLKKEELKILLNEANKNRISISESTVYQTHKAFKKFLSYREENKGLLSASFSIPKLDKYNFRNNLALGGGVINDMATYATSIGKYFWNSEIKNVSTDVVYRNELPIMFTINANFASKTKFNGVFAFESEYTNFVKYETKDFEIVYRRVFSPPPDLEVQLELTKNNVKSKVFVGKDDTFFNFFVDILGKINSSNFYVLNNEFMINNKDSLKLIEN